MPRIMRNTAILAKIETTTGTDAAPTGADNALLVSNASFEFNYNNVDRDPLRGYMGGRQSLPGTRFVRATFDVELTGSGTVGTAPAWGPLLLACAMAETTSATAVEYTPVSTGLKTLTIKYIVDGVLHTMLGCMGDVELDMQEGAIPMLKFNFTGRDGGTTEQAIPALTLTNWKTPTVITAENSGCLTLGGTYAAGVVTGGTTFPSRGLNVKLGNDLKQIATLCAGNQVDVTNRNTTGNTQLELTAAQEVQAVNDVNATVMTSLSFTHGTTAGAKVMVFAPNTQRLSPAHVDYEGRAHMSFELNFVPVVGNDELRIVAL
jgi:hypothetical protein